jgi:hypothetical protein
MAMEAIVYGDAVARNDQLQQVGLQFRLNPS